ncbi:MAG: MFS transporter [Erysipelotrichaceae bacterium]|nr:MFS transporter [Erysipelotrichaceae bacterium]
MNQSNNLSAKYMASQVCFFGAFAAMMGYASVFLLNKGFNNSTIGILLSLISVISVFLQPTIAAFADQHKEIEIRKIITSILVIAIIGSALLIVAPANQVLIFALVTITFTLVTSISPLMNTLAFVFEKYGIKINYGLARGLGSVSYAIVALVLGYVVEWFNADILPIFYVIFTALLFIIVNGFVVPKDAQVVEEETQEETQEETEQSSLSLLQFSLKYKKFVAFLLGFVCVYFAHTIINNYFIQIITPIGGTESDMGTAVFLAAMLELPTMAFYNKMSYKINGGTLIKISMILFIVKHFITYIATSMTLIYVAQVCQMGAYALFVPASVAYVNDKIAKQDIVKGQSFLTTANTLAGIFANLVGGVLLDAVGVSQVLLIGVILTVIGAIVVILTTEKMTTLNA